MGSLTQRHFTSEDVELLEMAANRAATALAFLMAQEEMPCGSR